MFLWKYISQILMAIWMFAFTVEAGCPFESPIASSTWVDNTKGTLTFTATTMSGWIFQSTRDTGSPITVNIGWQCVDHVTDSYLVLRTSSTFRLEPAAGSIETVYAYLCMKLIKQSNSSYIYYQQTVQQDNLGFERLKVSETSTLTRTEVCDDSLSVPASEYHVIIKDGEAEQAAVKCPNSLLQVVDYTWSGTDGVSKCSMSTDRWDVCTNTSQMEFDTTACSDLPLYTGDGKLWCVASIAANGYDYTTVYNQDAALTTSGARRFSCLCSSGAYASVAPDNCTAYQTPTSLPTMADQTTTIGQLIVVTQYFETCGSTATTDCTSGLSAGAQAAIAIVVIYVVFVWTMFTFIFIVIFFLMIYICANLNDLAIEVSGVRTSVPKLQLTFSDLKDTDLENSLRKPPEVIVTSPTSPSCVDMIHESTVIKDEKLKQNGIHNYQGNKHLARENSIKTAVSHENGHVKSDQSKERKSASSQQRNSAEKKPFFL